MGLELSLWTAPPDRPVLEAERVHLWRFRLDLPAAEIEHLKQLLSDDEISRANRLLDPTKQQNFIAGRARLRQILARYLDRPASSLQFSYGPSGKPQLAASPHSCFFNLSHAGSWALLAVTGDGEVGVDIEYIDPDLDYIKIARQFLPSTDLDRLMNSAPVRRRREFFRLWTTREAGLKACGTGFSKGFTNPGCHQNIRNLTLSRNYLGALAAESNCFQLNRWHLPQSFLK